MSVDLSHKSKRIRVDNRWIQTYTFGEGNKDILAFASFPHSGLYYRWLFSRVDLSDFRFLVFDTPGWIGKSGEFDKGERYTLEKSVEIAKAVVDFYRPRSRITGVVGYSFGAPLALKMIADRSASIEKLVLVSTLINTQIIKHKFKLQSEICKTFRLGWAVKRHVRNMFRLYKSELKTSEITDFLDDYGEMIEKCDNRVLLDSIYEMMHMDWVKYLDKIKDKRVLVVSSRDEDKLFKEQARITRSHLDNEKSMHIHGDHSDFTLKPNDEVLGQILDFLR